MIGPDTVHNSSSEFCEIFITVFLTNCWKCQFAHFHDKCTSPAIVCDGFSIWYFIMIGPDTVHMFSSQLCEIWITDFWPIVENVNFAHFRDKCTSLATVCDGFWSWYFIRIGPDTVHNSSSQICEIYLLFEIFLKVAILPISDENVYLLPLLWIYFEFDILFG